VLVRALRQRRSDLPCWWIGIRWRADRLRDRRLQYTTLPEAAAL